MISSSTSRRIDGVFVLQRPGPSEAERLLRDRRLIVLLGGAGVLVVAVVVGLVFLNGDGSPPRSGFPTTATTAAPPPTDPIIPVPFPDLGPTLPKVLARGVLRCGVGTNVPGFAIQLPSGRWEGFDVDMCRALAAVALGDPRSVEFVPLTAEGRWPALADGSVDVLFRNTSYTQARDTKVDFGPVTYYDGQQLLGRSDRFRTDSTVAELDGLSVCVGVDTTSVLNISEAAAVSGADIDLVEAATFDQAFDLFMDGQCNAVTSDGSALVGKKSRLEPDPGEWVIFPPAPFSKEPLAPVVRHDDSCWRDVVTWTFFALVIADEKGITAVNVELVAREPPDDEVGLLLGAEMANFQTAMRLDTKAFLRAIRSVGNYDEIYQRNLAPLGLSREASPNALSQDFGLLFAPPIRPDPLAVGEDWTFDFIGDAAENLWTSSTAHGLSVDDAIAFTRDGGGADEYAENTRYWVIAVPSTTTLQLSAARSGSVIEGSTDSSGNWAAQAEISSLLLQGNVCGSLQP